MLELLKIGSGQIGKKKWHPLLGFIAELHERALHAPFYKLPYLWEEATPSEEGEIVFGHWDTVHIALDTIELEPSHSRDQLLNLLSLQEESGFIPGPVYVYERDIHWSQNVTSPPVWPFVMKRYLDKHTDMFVLELAYQSAYKQIEWFELERKSESGGFYYLDILDNFCESGVEGSVRFEVTDELPEDFSCIDASSHLYLLYKSAFLWGDQLGKDVDLLKSKMLCLEKFIQEHLFSVTNKCYKDGWVQEKEVHFSFEIIWPLVAEVATEEQASAVIDNYLTHVNQFNTPHPIATLSMSDRAYECYSWRGPVRNSITYWAAIACLNYGRIDGARHLLESALDMTAKHFKETGTVWECYDPLGGDPEGIKVVRMGKEYYSRPDYLGHNPMIAMASLWDRLR